MEHVVKTNPKKIGPNIHCKPKVQINFGKKVFNKVKSVMEIW
jgi:hypothetical protein